jgi:hypothetical protein
MYLKGLIVLSAIVAISFLHTDIAQSQTYGLQIDVGQGDVAGISPVQFVVLDPLGRRTGFDPFANQWLAEIPGANYGAAGIGDQVNTEYEEDVPYEFITSSDQPPINGTYRVRLMGTEQSSYALSVGIHRDTSFLPLEAQGTCQPGSVAYYQFTYNSNPGVPITLAKVPPTNEVSGGIFNVGGGTLSVKAKPLVNFTSNALNTLVATFRWFTGYGITLSTPSSPTYGFQKWDSVIVVGNYSYQKFRAVGSVAINWEADVEYELFTTNVSGGTGTGDFELTNAIPGGEWFVDINYSDKSDTLFYHPIASETPLPIELLYFSARVLVNNSVFCEWATLTETNNYGFFVQKSRTATSGFTDIPGSFVPGHGTTLVPQYYSYTDQSTSHGTWFYRLKQIDLDGTTHYTDPVQVYVPEGQIEVEDFAASNSNQRQVSLGWATRREVNNNRFEVQVSRDDSLHFRTIPNSAVPGHGTTNTRHLYTYRDVRPSTGTWFFRLKQFNENGRARYTNMIRADVR